MSNSAIYSITSNVNKDIYIGSAVSFSARKGVHLYDLRNNKHHNYKIQNIFNNYGENSLIFNSISQAAKEYKMQISTLCKQLKGINKNKTDLRYLLLNEYKIKQL